MIRPSSGVAEKRFRWILLVTTFAGILISDINLTTSSDCLEYNHMTKALLDDKKLNNFIRKTTIETVREIFNDPDYGLPLTLQTIGRLKKSLKSKKAGRLVDFEEILKRCSK